MKKLTTSTAIPTRALKLEALSSISASFELFCLASGMEALGDDDGRRCASDLWSTACTRS